MKENVPLDDPDVEANQEQTMWGEPQEGDAEMECDIDFSLPIEPNCIMCQFHKTS